MHFAAADETYEKMWYSSLVDRDKLLETVSTVSMNFMYNFLAIKYALRSGIIVQSHLDFLGICRIPPRHVYNGNKVLLFPLPIFLELPSTNLPSAS